MFQQLLTNPHAETLMKADEIELFRYIIYHPKEVDKYWNSIKVAMRHGYKFEDVQMWFDYIRMLDTMGRDLNSQLSLRPLTLKQYTTYMSERSTASVRKSEEKPTERKPLKTKPSSKN